MTELECWQKVMQEMKTEQLMLSPKISSTIRTSLTGMLFILARYKFGMQMMRNRPGMKIIDFGCNDGIGDFMIRQNIEAEFILGVDFDKDAIQWAKENIQDDILYFEEADFLGRLFVPGG